MTNLTTVSRLACLTIVLAAGTMMATANIANAKGDRHQDNKAQNNGARPHGVMSGQPVRVKKVLRDRKDCRKEDCEKAQTKTNTKPAQPTAQGGAPAPKFVVSGQPTNVKSVAGGPTTLATVSNGVNTSSIFNGKGSLTVTAASPTSITVTNSDHSSVTLGGESITLSGARSVQTAPGMEVHRLPNGDVTIAIKPTVASTPARPVPPGVTPVDDIKALHAAGAQVGAVPIAAGIGAVIALGALEVGVVTGHPIKLVEDTVSSYTKDVGNWVAGWF